MQDYLNSKTFELNGYPSQIRWLPQCTQPKVPIDIIGTGPKILAFAAKNAELVTLAVGADLKRLKWAVNHIHDNCQSPRPRIGAYINICVCDDHTIGAEMVRSGIKKLQNIISLGIQRFVVIGPNLSEFPKTAKIARERFVKEVLPYVH